MQTQACETPSPQLSLCAPTPHRNRRQPGLLQKMREDGLRHQRPHTSRASERYPRDGCDSFSIHVKTDPQLSKLRLTGRMLHGTAVGPRPQYTGSHQRGRHISTHTLSTDFYRPPSTQVLLSPFGTQPGSVARRVTGLAQRTGEEVLELALVIPRLGFS